jgi:hypothetical protein
MHGWRSWQGCTFRMHFLGSELQDVAFWLYVTRCAAWDLRSVELWTLAGGAVGSVTICEDPHGLFCTAVLWCLVVRRSGVCAFTHPTHEPECKPQRRHTANLSQCVLSACLSATQSWHDSVCDKQVSDFAGWSAVRQQDASPACTLKLLGDAPARCHAMTCALLTASH